MGYRYATQEKYDEAIAVFTLNTEMYPDSWNVWDSLGEAQLKNGQTDLALANYEKSLKLNPESESGKAAVTDIKAAQVN